MSFFEELKHNVSSIIAKAPLDRTLQSNDTSMQSVNWTGKDDTPFDKQAVYPNWFFSARLGQPRSFEPRTLKKLARSPWIQMVLNTFKKQVSTTKWRIAPIDDEDETDYTEQIKLIEAKLNNINKNEQTIDDLNSELITDIGVIDAGVLNFVYTSESYEEGQLPVYNNLGEVISTEKGFVLKPMGQRELLHVKSVDGSTMLKQVDLYKNLLSYWQYSFKHPKMNPTLFQKEEISYLIMNQQPDSIYGFSPVQSMQQVVELLIEGTRYNKDLYKNNAIPDLLVSLPKLPDSQLKKIKRQWNNQYKGKPHQIGFINWAIENITKLVETNRDLEWLEGQKWYHKIPFALYGVSPEEVGYFENSNRATGESQEKVTVRNALIPYYRLFERNITNRIIPEILQMEITGLKFEYILTDNVKEKAEFDQDMKELENAALTINEYRVKRGRDKVSWGDEPYQSGFNPMAAFGKDDNKGFSKKFEVFMNGRKS